MCVPSLDPPFSSSPTGASSSRTKALNPPPSLFRGTSRSTSYPLTNPMSPSSGTVGGRRETLLPQDSSLFLSCRQKWGHSHGSRTVAPHRVFSVNKNMCVRVCTQYVHMKEAVIWNEYTHPLVLLLAATGGFGTKVSSSIRRQGSPPPPPEQTTK